jgi:hypothetical protein
MSNSPSRLGTGKSVQLHDNGLRAGSLLEQLPAYLTSEQVQKLAAEAVEESIRIEGKARERDLDYRAATRAIEEHIPTVNRLPGGQIHSTTTSINTGSRNMTIKSGACFVATTAYGDRNHPDVVLLRKFRDEVLTRSSVGRSFIDWYWRTGPYLARGISHSPHLRSGSRWLISCLVLLIRKHF